MPGAKTRVKSDAARYDTVRGAATMALTVFDGGGVSLEDALLQTKGLVEYDELDARFLKLLVSGVTKLKRRLDYQLRFYLARPAEKLSDKLQNILRLGLFQLQFVDRIPQASAVDESVKLGRYFFGEPKARMVNAILRSYLREPNKAIFPDVEDDTERYLAEFYSYPDYFVSYCLREFGASAAEELLASMNRPPQLTIRVNLLKAKAPEIESALERAGLDFQPGAFLEEFYVLSDASISKLSALLKNGKIYAQDQSAGMAVRLLNPRPGVTLCDLAAAPGGKTTYAASRMRGKGRITAIDKSRRRLEILVENCKRMGVKIVAPVATDAMIFDPPERYERVMIDPPCSGWGTAAKHPDLRWRKTEKDIKQMTKIQRKMLEKGASLLKPGGILVYSTCTLMRDENDQIIEEFLLKNKEFELESAETFFDKSVVSERGFVKTYPCVEGLDGGFAARLKRRPA
ncbi:MAG: 16S rRNA (cytosine(967)-C(5))-methyltransferase RsmB [Candidatus Zixiibacteriota bacterium]